ncbi:MAG: hypothetical protein ABI831_08250 [Betaproteobacteria bacterium]
MLWAPSAHAYRWYDDGAGNGCVSCHNGFQGGNGALHFQHRTKFAVTTCNLCHPNGGGTTPVLTYSSGPGGGFGCAGCHGQDYGETSPNSGQPKATSYGLRQFHVNQGVTTCGTSGCHKPGTQGHPNPFPTLYGENVAPPYYGPLFSNLTDPCASSQEDLLFDADSVGLDNDGDGVADYPADSDCAAPVDTATPSPTPTIAPNTPTPTLGIDCGTAPALACIAPAKGRLILNEKKAGKEKLKVTLTKLLPAVTQGQFGNPVTGNTAYKLCIYDAANQLKGNYTIRRAAETCGTAACWSAISDKGYKYRDKSTAADGILKMKLIGGAAGKGKIKVIGKNTSGHLPTGIAALMQNQASATVQILTTDASCFGVGLTQVKKADGTVFSATGP